METEMERRTNQMQAKQKKNWCEKTMDSILCEQILLTFQTQTAPQLNWNLKWQFYTNVLRWMKQACPFLSTCSQRKKIGANMVQCQDENWMRMRFKRPDRMQSRNAEQKWERETWNWKCILARWRFVRWYYSIKCTHAQAYILESPSKCSYEKSITVRIKETLSESKHVAFMIVWCLNIFLKVMIKLTW